MAPNQKFGVCLRTSAPSAEMLVAGPGQARRPQAVLRRPRPLSLHRQRLRLRRVQEAGDQGRRLRAGLATPERREYTKQVADLLAELAPEGVNPSIQSAPLGFKPKVTGADVVDGVHRPTSSTWWRTWSSSKKKTGKTVTLGLEPEPRCYLETTDETDHLLPGATCSRPQTAERLAKTTGLHEADAAAAMRKLHGRRVRHRPPVGRLRGHPGVAAEAGRRRRADRQAAGSGVDVHPRRHAEDGGRAAGVRQDDLPVADLPEEGRQDDLVPEPRGRLRGLVRRTRARASGARTSTCRCSSTTSAPFGTTRFALEQALAFHKKTPLSTHLEIETYTWDVLPDHLKTGDIVDYVTREIEWVKGQLV